MQSPTDILYIRTKQKLYGQRKLSKELHELAEWIKTKLGLNVLNIELDKIDGNKRDRINIILTSKEEVSKTRIGQKPIGNFNPQYQEQIVDKFNNVASNNRLTESLNTLLKRKPFVCFHSFNDIAISEANGKITQEFLKQIESKYSEHGLWKILPFFETRFLFFLTTNNLKTAKSNGIFDQIVNELFFEIKKHDEFDLISKQQFGAIGDSKEVLDEKYEGNFFYYLK